MIKLNEENLKNLIRKIITEVNYNYHIGNIKDVTNVQPHMSDSKFQMRGRDTGHFGSGLYFSTYNCYEKHSKVTRDETNTESNLIQIKDGVYRVDMDLYKNLYRVYNENQGNTLFKTLKEINGLYRVVSDFYQYNDSLPSNFSQIYLICGNNMKYLGLKLPDYKQFIYMCKEHYYSGVERPQSMSTVIMEYNGFNGVNVSDIPSFDNTLHGSVIYDLSKTDTEFKKVNVDFYKCKSERGKGGEYVAGDFFDIKSRLMRGDDVINLYPDDFIRLPIEEQIIAIKRYKYFIPKNILDQLEQNIKTLYYRTLGNKIKKGVITVQPKSYVVNDLIYDPNVIFENGKTFLLVALESNLTSDNEKKLLGNIRRTLSKEEQEELDWLKT